MGSPKLLRVILLTFTLSCLRSTVGHPSTGIQKNMQQPKVQGGRDANPGELPYQLSLRIMGFHYCGASLAMVHGIQIAITAAHCVFLLRNAAAVSKEDVDVTLVAGDLNLADTTGLEQIQKVTQIAIHEGFRFLPSFTNDLAILFMEHPFDIKEGQVETILLPRENQATTGNLTVSGWDWVAASSFERLQVATMLVADNELCKDMLTAIGKENGEGILCASVPNEGQTTCVGDAGGPARSVNGGYLAGVVSSSFCELRFPTEFTEVSKYVTWIEDQVTHYESTMKVD